MNDFELNKAIGSYLYPKSTIRRYEGSTLLVHHKSQGRRFFFEENYVENWQDLMPLVVEHSKDMDWDLDEDFFHFMQEHENPQRALALCLLKVLESKSE